MKKGKAFTKGYPITLLKATPSLNTQAGQQYEINIDNATKVQTFV